MTSNAILCSTWRLYVIVDRAAVGAHDPVAVASAAIRGGADVLQWRDKEADDASFLRIACQMYDVARAAGVALILNDRVELAAALGADGVHLGQEDLPIAEARARLGPGALIGKSTHSVTQARAAARDGADYLGFGPLYPTPTKPDYPSVGLEQIRAVQGAVPVPVVCIGGVDEQRLGAVLAAGAERVAVVRAVCSAQNPQAAARRLRTILTETLHVMPPHGL